VAKTYGLAGKGNTDLLASDEPITYGSAFKLWHGSGRGEHKRRGDIQITVGSDTKTSAPSVVHQHHRLWLWMVAAHAGVLSNVPTGGNSGGWSDSVYVEAITVNRPPLG
jgi:hypothetical protein